MTPSVKTIVNQVSKLSPLERAEIIDCIMESFDSDPDPEIQRAWAAEAEKRLSNYKNGNVKTITADDLFKKFSHLEDK